ncbi:hypothetical protein ACFLYQ_06065 [Chloroflexota bacterium]
MAEECCSDKGCGCGCSTTNLYSDKDCPDCGRRLRITGNLQKIQLNLTCPECGYQSPQLSMEELQVLID